MGDTNEKTIINIRAVQVQRTRYSPHYQAITAEILSVSNGKKRKKEKSETFFGYLPSYSPGIEYNVTVDAKNMIVCINSWKRLVWWLDESFVGPTLNDYWKKDRLDRIAIEFKKKIFSKESDFSVLSEYQDAFLLFNRHFFPNVWFDLAVLNKDGRNIYSSHILEPRESVIVKWQTIMDKDPVEAFLKCLPPVPKLSWDNANQLICAAKARKKTGPLSDKDKELESYWNRYTQTENIVTGIDNTKKMSLLDYPPKSSHPYKKPNDNFVESFKTIQTLRNRLEWGGECIISHQITSKKLCNYMQDNELLVQLATDHWTTPDVLRDARSIDAFLENYYYQDGVPKDIKETSPFESRICTIDTNGHINYEKLRDLLSESQEGSILFRCPDNETRQELRMQIDCNEDVDQNDFTKKPDAIIFCFCHSFSLSNMAKEIERVAQKGKDFWPDRIIFMGNRTMDGIQGYGTIFQDLIDYKQIAHFEEEFSRESFEPDIAEFLDALHQGKPYQELPWTDQVQLCFPEKFKEFFNSSLHTADPNSYHILSDDGKVVNLTEREIRPYYPNGFKIMDKVWSFDSQKMDYIRLVWPMTKNGAGFEQLRGVAFSNQANHSVRLSCDQESNHRECCQETTPGRFLLSRHPLKWSTIQTFKDNKIPNSDHIVLLLGDHSKKRALYSAIMMAKSKLTIVATYETLANALKREEKEKTRISLLLFSHETNKMEAKGEVELLAPVF